MGPSFSVCNYAAMPIIIGIAIVAAVLNGDVHAAFFAVGMGCLGGAAVFLRPRIEIGDDEVIIRNLRSVAVNTGDCITFLPVSRPWSGASLLVHQQFAIRAYAPRVFPLMFPWSKEYRESFDRRLRRLNDELDRRRPPPPA
jgi:hypothetical protein